VIRRLAARVLGQARCGELVVVGCAGARDSGPNGEELAHAGFSFFFYFYFYFPFLFIFLYFESFKFKFNSSFIFKIKSTIKNQHVM
jgi:hypothetical protein